MARFCLSPRRVAPRHRLCPPEYLLSDWAPCHIRRDGERNATIPRWPEKPTDATSSSYCPLIIATAEAMSRVLRFGLPLSS